MFRGSSESVATRLATSSWDHPFSRVISRALEVRLNLPTEWLDTINRLAGGR